MSLKKKKTTKEDKKLKMLLSSQSDASAPFKYTEGGFQQQHI